MIGEAIHLGAEGMVASGRLRGSCHSTAANEEAAGIALRVHHDMTPSAMHAFLFSLPGSADTL